MYYSSLVGPHVKPPKLRHQLAAGDVIEGACNAIGRYVVPSSSTEWAMEEVHHFCESHLCTSVSSGGILLRGL